jgi:hypothetical protein
MLVNSAGDCFDEIIDSEVFSTGKDSPVKEA